MQVIRQSLTTTFQRSITLPCCSLIVQQIRYDGSDPRSSTVSDNHKNKSDVKKPKGGDKKQKSTSIDDTTQSGTTQKDSSKPNQVGKGGSSSKGKK